MNADPTCIFCGILSGKIPCHKVYETEHSFAFLDIMPVSEGHTQVIPKCKSPGCRYHENRIIEALSLNTDHAKTIGDLPDEYLSDIGPVIKKIALATGVEQYNIVQVSWTS
ncbi:hypothetical protein BT96DRAFT_543539 [Gymnopus androsaceus JB14]|uniref:HIT domain-containing protein n=1 Tax=Gymnopus androsaceus JB14 TaxID=1447944 RepID=A0A6A4HVX2_9AGAR|nr:hypothetical protein BT96DRAFT_543539 [Gymnopus androsaceus JB14]